MMEIDKLTPPGSREIWWVPRNRRWWKVFKSYTTFCVCSSYKFGLYSKLSHHRYHSHYKDTLKSINWKVLSMFEMFAMETNKQTPPGSGEI